MPPEVLCDRCGKHAGWRGESLKRADVNDRFVVLCSACYQLWSSMFIDNPLRKKAWAEVRKAQDGYREAKATFEQADSNYNEVRTKLANEFMSQS